MLPCGILADDLTGACDTGGQFSSRGARVCVLVGPGAPVPAPAPDAPPWDVLVLDADHRHLPAAEAAARTAAGLRRLRDAGWPLRYLKIDSTLRGPLAAEAAALLAADAVLVVAPAFPPAGRTVVDGVLCVAGVPVHETELGRDALNPVPESRVAAVIAPAAQGCVAHLGLRDVAAGAAGVAERLRALLAGGARIVVADATEQTHLDALAGALLRHSPPPWQARGIAVGAAGLAGAFARLLATGPPPAPPDFPRAGPVLVVAGSRSSVTRGQVDALRAAGAHGVELAPDALDAPDWDALRGAWLADYAAQVARTLDAADGGSGAARAGNGGDSAAACVLTIRQAPPGAAQSAGPAYRLRSERLNDALGALVARVARQRPLGGLVLTGGDIARAVLDALGVSALQLGAEVVPGLPLAWPVGQPAAVRMGASAGAGDAHPGLPLVTKAGGFGAPDALCEAVRFLRHGARASC